MHSFEMKLLSILTLVFAAAYVFMLPGCRSCPCEKENEAEPRGTTLRLPNDGIIKIDTSARETINIQPRYEYMAERKYGKRAVCVESPNGKRALCYVKEKDDSDTGIGKVKFFVFEIGFDRIIYSDEFPATGLEWFNDKIISIKFAPGAAPGGPEDSGEYFLDLDTKVIYRK